MKSTRYIIVSLFAGIAGLTLFTGWGGTGHSIINDNMVIHLPAAMKGFVDNRSIIKARASEADSRKANDSKLPYLQKESPRHFIDIDAYSEFATKSVPTNLSALLTKYDSATVFGNGINPWATLWTLDSLTAQMRRGEWSTVWLTTADLGHYVGDAHQPLHATKYFGTSDATSRPGSGSGGIHSRYESAMIDSNKVSLTVVPNNAQFVPDPIAYIFAYTYQSNSFVDSLYDVDVAARQVSQNAIDGKYYAALWEGTKNFTKIQFQRATQDFANLVYTAWVNAGSPPIPSISLVETDTHIPLQLQLKQNYPNPFNPSTVIEFQIRIPSHVRLCIFDIRGRAVANLVNDQLSAGTYRLNFDARLFANAMPSSGVYLIRLESAHQVATQKMVLLK